MIRHDRDGFALPAALLALIIIAALVTGGAYAAMTEDWSSGSVDYGDRAFMAAEIGMESLLGTKNRPYFEDSVGVVGAADTLGPITVDVGGVDAEYTLYVQRLSTLLFKVDAEGRVVNGGRYSGATRRISELMRITHTSVPTDRAVTSHGPLYMRGTSGISGADSMPSGWSDPACTDVGTQAAVQAHSDDPKYIDIKGSAGLDGSPQVRTDPTMDSLDFVQYGDLHLDDLKRSANIVLPTGTYNGMTPSTTAAGACNTTDTNNWGDKNNPSGACHTYWPVIYSPGSLQLTNGTGQGILIVDGDLSATGNFEFTGLVFVYGGMSMTGSGNHFTGSVNIYANGDTVDIDNKGAGSSSIRLSSCAIERAHRYADRFSRPIPLAMRRFVDLTGTGAN